MARLHKNPLRAAGFKVLKSPDVPSVLLELGYVSSKQDLKLLTSGPGAQRVAGATVQAIDTYFATRIAGGGAEGRIDGRSASLSLTIKSATKSAVGAISSVAEGCRAGRACDRCGTRKYEGTAAELRC